MKVSLTGMFTGIVRDLRRARSPEANLYDLSLKELLHNLEGDPCHADVLLELANK